MVPFIAVPLKAHEVRGRANSKRPLIAWVAAMNVKPSAIWTIRQYLSKCHVFDNVPEFAQLSDMDPRKEQILEAAIAVISRYGLKRTSVADIARAAGVARQTVYNSFVDKDEIVRECVRHYEGKTRVAVEAELKNAPSLDRKLDVLIDHLAVQKYDMLAAHPEAADIMNGVYEIAAQELEEVSASSRQTIEKMLRPYAGAVRKSGQSVPQLAEFIQQSLYHAKHEAKDKKQLLRLAGSLKALVLALAQSGDAG